jgi:hypothetical protein
MNRRSPGSHRPQGYHHNTHHQKRLPAFFDLFHSRAPFGKQKQILLFFLFQRKPFFNPFPKKHQSPAFFDVSKKPLVS